MSVVYVCYYRTAGESCAHYAEPAIKKLSINAHVWERWKHTLRCIESIDRYELYAVDRYGNAVGLAALAFDNDFNLGDCITVAAAASAGGTGFMRYVINCAKRFAKELDVRYVAYTKTITPLRYELRYLEV